MQQNICVALLLLLKQYLFSNTKIISSAENYKALTDYETSGHNSTSYNDNIWQYFKKKPSLKKTSVSLLVISISNQIRNLYI